jgi:hypothetical protein
MYRCYADQLLYIATYATISEALAILQQHMTCLTLNEPLTLDTPHQHLDTVALHNMGQRLLTLMHPLSDSTAHAPKHPTGAESIDLPALASACASASRTFSG